ncbi:hypothetical protein [Bacillus sonorensis]|uniref:hypothetical protein n=1 Tax=Bacillus sonorensis TaxID=119858 RepID=UPI003B985075
MAKTKKYVRILKAKYESMWYADKIGEVFELTGDTAPLYVVRVPGYGRCCLVYIEDAELIVTEKRPAKVGERVLITDKYGTSGEYKNGDILTADLCIGYAITTKEVDLTFIFHSEYEVIVNNEVKNEEADGMNKMLVDQAKTVFERKDDKYFGYKSRLGDIVIGGAYSYAFVVHYAKTNEDVVIIPGDVNTVTTPVCTTEEERLWKPEKTAQERRDEIVEQAKADIEGLKTDYSYAVPDSNDPDHPHFCFAEFIVDNEKRTIVALLRGNISCRVYARGIAKAAPDDCFNVHIGMSIALHRALGLEVPDEYLNAPQPTEVRVGDVICTPHGSMHKVNKRHINEISDSYLSRCKIIDDSRTEVDE